MAFSETFTFLVYILITTVIITEMVVFYFYYRKKAKEMNKRLPKMVNYIIFSTLFCCVYDLFLFLLNYKIYKMCYKLEEA